GGTIELDGVNIEQLSLDSLRANLSLVGQESVLFDDTVAANIAYGAGREVTQREIEQAALDANALEFILRLPEGFDSRIGEDGVRLSGGQRQRLAIARALIKDAPVLLLDEATSALDTESERMVQDALARLTANRTTLVIAHRLSTVKHADRILVIKEGRIVERGKHEELISLDGEYTELCRHQFGDAVPG
ncbi:MAG: ATP-binding cassette domain-containing protein, partial [Gammaproteobacteria bacterium]|nr:ATP-binding cassette domain-containing protein [Gammaproteobacteria bacterium]